MHDPLLGWLHDYFPTLFIKVSDFICNDRKERRPLSFKHAVVGSAWSSVKDFLFQYLMLNILLLNLFNNEFGALRIYDLDLIDNLSEVEVGSLISGLDPHSCPLFLGLLGFLVNCFFGCFDRSLLFFGTFYSLISFLGRIAT